MPCCERQQRVAPLVPNLPQLPRREVSATLGCTCTAHARGVLHPRTSALTRARPPASDTASSAARCSRFVRPSVSPAIAFSTASSLCSQQRVAAVIAKR